LSKSEGKKAIRQMQIIRGAFLAIWIFFQ